MLKDTELKIIRDVSQQYHVRRVLLFGSSLEADDDTRDIDIAVEGVSPEAFFEYYGDLMMQLPRPVDVVDLSLPTKFNELVLRDGVPIYG